MQIPPMTLCVREAEEGGGEDDAAAVWGLTRFFVNFAGRSRAVP